MEQEEQEKENQEPKSSEDWVSHGLLPTGWKYSFTLKNQPDRKNGYKRLFKFKTETGRVVKSAWQAIQHLKEDKKYKRKDLDNMIEFVKNNKKEEENNTELVNDFPVPDPTLKTPTKIIDDDYEGMSKELRLKFFYARLNKYNKYQEQKESVIKQLDKAKNNALQKISERRVMICCLCCN